MIGLIFNFIAFTLLAALIHTLYLNIRSNYDRKNKPDWIIHKDDGLITNFKTGKTEVQKGSVFRY